MQAKINSLYIKNLKNYTRTLILLVIFLTVLITTGLLITKPTSIISPIISSLSPLEPLKTSKTGYEVFGFAPFWTINSLENVDYKTLTTLAYFGMEIDENGDIVTDEPGYTVFHGKKATEIFKKAHASGTRVVLTITQMDNDTIKEFLSSREAQDNAINQVVSQVKQKGIDGVNVDFEYVGSPGSEVRDSYSDFVSRITERMHQEIPKSKVTVSVYASSAKPGSKKLYDIAKLGNSTDGVFMMAYDFAVAGSEIATPTAPLYGKKEGRYSNDIATSVKEFTRVMPANKLILGVPYYGYNYMTVKPQINSETRPSPSWRGRAKTQTYALVKSDISESMEGIDEYKEGWDDIGKVSYKAYHVTSTNTWRMIFLDDSKSLGIKYDFAKSQNLAGVGMWALGFDKGSTELWEVLREKFGEKYADSNIISRKINDNI